VRTGRAHLRLPFQAPLCPDNLFGHLAATAVPGVEEVRGGRYRRTLRLPHGPGIIDLSPDGDAIDCRLTLVDPGDKATALARCRWLLDLDADPLTIDEHLARDPALRPLIRAAAGRRVPRSIDGAEFAVRAVLGQQVSTAAARTHAARLVAEFGEPVPDLAGGLTHLFPTPRALGRARPALPERRRRTLSLLVEALASGRLVLDPDSDRKRARAVMAELPGIGPWTIEVIAMRALGDPDAFPVSDLGVRRGAGVIGLPTTPGALLAHARAWQPWRAYAVQYLWSATDHDINHWPRRRVNL
jgi:AraC family transcriptional regulator of adaptative response / DNA-3-methyladenine glycosylase II